MINTLRAQVPRFRYLAWDTQRHHAVLATTLQILLLQATGRNHSRVPHLSGSFHSSFLQSPEPIRMLLPLIVNRKSKTTLSWLLPISSLCLSLPWAAEPLGGVVGACYLLTGLPFFLNSLQPPACPPR